MVAGQPRTVFTLAGTGVASVDRLLGVPTAVGTRPLRVPLLAPADRMRIRVVSKVRVRSIRSLVVHAKEPGESEQLSCGRHIESRTSQKRECWHGSQGRMYR